MVDPGDDRHHSFLETLVNYRRQICEKPSEISRVIRSRVQVCPGTEPNFSEALRVDVVNILVVILRQRFWCFEPVGSKSLFD